MYSVTDEAGKTQQYMMLCPKDMDQNVLIQTLVKQIQSDPATKGSGKKTIKITQQKGALQKITGLPPGSRVVSQTVTHSPSNKQQQQQQAKKQPNFKQQQHTPQAVRGVPQKRILTTTAQTGTTPTVSASSTPKTLSPAKTPTPAKKQPQLLMSSSSTPTTTTANRTPKPSVVNNDLFSSMQPVPQSSVRNVVDASDIFESVVPDLPLEPPDGSTRVYVRCNYCTNFKSSLNGDTWESILNHILPVAKEEIQTSFYGDLSKHFIRSLRVQINGKQMVKKFSKEVPQCEVILTHSLVCRKTKREFIVNNPDANFVASLAKHIRVIQPGNSGRGNSLLCIFCNSPFTHEDYLRHIQPHLDGILATLNTFAGAYCANLYDSTIRAARSCHICQEEEAADLRFLPCTKFSPDYTCVKKLQFAIDCFREHYGDSGFLRLNTSTVAKCSVCKNSQQVYCAVFHISTTILGDDDGQQPVDTQLAVCVNCQKQFINIVMKEQGFEERLKLFQLKNMEQLCSVLRVILNQASQICQQQKTLIYTVHENMRNPNSSVHIVKTAEITSLAPVTKLMARAESEIGASKTKAFYICDLCLFTVDLTSIIATDTEKQKNEMLLAIVLEHLVPHTESLTSVIASTSTSNTMNLKYEMISRVQDMPPNNQQIVLCLQKKFKSPNSNLEVVLDKDENKTMSLLRAGVKAERKNLVVQKNSKGASPANPNSPYPDVSAGAAAHLVEINKFIDRQKGKLGILALTGCNTSLLNLYTECKLCSKFSFPDFRLAAGTSAAATGDEMTKPVQLCENCVETVLSLCLPTEPECLQEPEECLALGETRVMGHRLVLSNNLKKWLSLDGVNLIKKTVDDFDETKHVDCGNIFQDGLKRHAIAVLKTCQKDEDITNCAAGFCITDSFLNIDRKDETAAALASLERQIGMPIKQAGRDLKPNEIQVTILARRPKKTTPKMTTSLPRVAHPSHVTPQRTYVRRTPTTTPVTRTNNGTVINVGEKIRKTIPTTTASGTTASSSAGDEEETVSAIQSFLDATAAKEGTQELKVPAGIRITPTGKGTYNIRAVADSSSAQQQQQQKSTPSLAGLSPSTVVTRGGQKINPKTATAVRSSPTKAPNGTPVKDSNETDLNNDENDEEGEEEEEEEEDSDAVEGEEETPRAPNRKKRGRQSEEYKSDADADASTSSVDTPSRSKRQRKEKKIFDL